MGNRAKINTWNSIIVCCTTICAVLCAIVGTIIIVWVLSDNGFLYSNGNNESKYIYTPPVTIPPTVPQTFGVQTIPAMRPVYQDMLLREFDYVDDVPRININVGGENSIFEERFEEDFGTSRIRGKRRMPVKIKRGR